MNIKKLQIFKTSIFLFLCLTALDSEAQLFQKQFGTGSLEEPNFGINTYYYPFNGTLTYVQGQAMVGSGCGYSHTDIVKTQIDGIPFFSKIYHIKDKNDSSNQELPTLAKCVSESEIDASLAIVGTDFDNINFHPNGNGMKKPYFINIAGDNGNFLFGKTYNTQPSSINPLAFLFDNANFIVDQIITSKLNIYGYYYVCGKINSPNYSNGMCWRPFLTCLDPAGKVVWSKVYTNIRLETIISATNNIDSKLSIAESINSIALCGTIYQEKQAFIIIVDPFSGIANNINNSSNLLLFNNQNWSNISFNSIKATHTLNNINPGFVLTGFTNESGNRNLLSLSINNTLTNINWSFFYDNLDINGLPTNSDNLGLSVCERFNSVNNSFEYYFGGIVVSGSYPNGTPCSIDYLQVFKTDVFGHNVSQFFYESNFRNVLVGVDKFDGTNGNQGISLFSTHKNGAIGKDDFYMLKSNFNGLTSLSVSTLPASNNTDCFQDIVNFGNNNNTSLQFEMSYTESLDMYLQEEHELDIIYDENMRRKNMCESDNIDKVGEYNPYQTQAKKVQNQGDEIVDKYLIEVPLNGSNQLTVNVYSLQGKLVLQKQLNNISQLNINDLNSVGITSGTYIIEIKSDNTIVHKKISINNNH